MNYFTLDDYASRGPDALSLKNESIYVYIYLFILYTLLYIYKIPPWIYFMNNKHMKFMEKYNI